MTSAQFPTTPLHLTVTRPDGAGHAMVIDLHGDLDYDSADHLLQTATQQISDDSALTDLHLGCAGLEAIDSMGLSVLLMIQRRTTAADVVLHLDGRTARLDRLLTITGTLDHLTGSVPPR
ncbi:STAS domain-containing protein [Streptomyces sp. NBC_00289]|uniref:STAS domain-containing protein n=1 Tax=Streptomyces sp. NBC_00289 TaxID=2975703 RepID=UPI003247E23B